MWELMTARGAKARPYDVCVIGSGLAGVRAAIAAAEAGAQVLLVSTGPILSGSSFDGASWGLGLIAPKGPADQEDLIASILELGQGMAQPKIVRRLVMGIQEAIDGLEKEGFRFKKPVHPQDKTLIPCFDRGHRRWQGLLFAEMRRFFKAKLAAHAIDLLPFHQLEDLESLQSKPAGPPFLVSFRPVAPPSLALQAQAPQWVLAKTLVLATGGFASLYAHRIPGPAASGLGHIRAYALGAALENLEFIQFIPALLAPVYGCIFNERSFGLLDLSPHAKALGVDETALKALLNERATHGPMSSRLPDAVIDRFLFDAWTRHKPPLSLHYRKDAFDQLSEAGQMVQDAFRWQEERHGITPQTAITLAPFFHASHGGIVIDEEGMSHCPGLFAAGEATAGHCGADRIGGLSTANALVFGRIAGQAAARMAKTLTLPSLAIPKELPATATISSQWVAETLKALQTSMYERASIRRSAEGLMALSQQIEGWQAMLQGLALSPEAKALAAHLALALLLVQSMQKRHSSLGAHWRQDAPDQLPEEEKGPLRWQAGKAEFQRP